MKKLIILTLTICGIILTSSKLNASYNYAFWDQIDSAEAMRVLRVIDNSNLVDENDVLNPIELGDLRDVFSYNGLLYVSDATANQVHVFNESFQYVKSLPSVTDEAGTLNSPQGIHVFNDHLYVADYNNERIAIFDLTTDLLVSEVKEPDDVIFDNLKFKPLKVSVDRTGRMNVIAYDVFEGVMEFDVEGNFNRYFGTNTIKLSVLDALIYRFSTREQREKMALKLQTSFTSLDIDADGYIFTVSRLEYWAPVKKLNFKGRNVLEDKGYVGVVGDAKFQETDTRTNVGPSSIVDITVHPSMQRYSIIDNNRGRIFTYDADGHLLYVSGGLGSEQNKLSGPTAVSYHGEMLVVTDNVSKSIMIFEPVQFGELVNLAIDQYYNMAYLDAKATWEAVLKLNSNYFLAYAGIGRAQLRQGEYKPAMENLELGYDYYNYSKAFEQNRNDSLAKTLPYVLVIGFGLAIFGISRSIKQAIKREGDD